MTGSMHDLTLPKALLTLPHLSGLYLAIKHKTDRPDLKIELDNQMLKEIKVHGTLGNGMWDMQSEYAGDPMGDDVNSTVFRAPKSAAQMELLALGLEKGSQFKHDLSQSIDVFQYFLFCLLQTDLAVIDSFAQVLDDFFALEYEFS